MKVNVAVPGSHPSFNKPTAVSVDGGARDSSVVRAPDS